MPLTKLHISFNISKKCLVQTHAGHVEITCCKVPTSKWKMPALTGHKCQALQKWTGGSRTFGKCARCLFMDTNSTSDFGNTFISIGKNSDASIEVWSDGVGPWRIQRKGLTGIQTEYAVWKYKSHRCIKMTLFTEWTCSSTFQKRKFWSQKKCPPSQIFKTG